MKILHVNSFQGWRSKGGTWAWCRPHIFPQGCGKRGHALTPDIFSNYVILSIFSKNSNWINAPPKIENLPWPFVTKITCIWVNFWELYGNPWEFSKLLPSFSPQSSRFFWEHPRHHFQTQNLLLFSKILEIREWGLVWHPQFSRPLSCIHTQCLIWKKIYFFKPYILLSHQVALLVCFMPTKITPYFAS